MSRRGLLAEAEGADLMLVFTKDALHACTENVRISPDVRICTYRSDEECVKLRPVTAPRQWGDPSVRRVKVVSG